MLNAESRRRQRWLLFAGRRPLHPRSRRAGFVVAWICAIAVVVLVVSTLHALGAGAAKSAIWPLAILGSPWSLVVAITSPAWGGFSYSATPDWLLTSLFTVPALVNASIAGGLVARSADSRRRRRQRFATSLSARS